MKFFADVHCYHMINPIVSGEPLNLHPVAPPRGGSTVATITNCKDSQSKRCSKTSRSALYCPLVVIHGKFIYCPFVAIVKFGMLASSADGAFVSKSQNHHISKLEVDSYLWILLNPFLGGDQNKMSVILRFVCMLIAKTNWQRQS